jgi:hypothetical protein
MPLAYCNNENNYQNTKNMFQVKNNQKFEWELPQGVSETIELKLSSKNLSRIIKFADGRRNGRLQRSYFAQHWQRIILTLYAWTIKFQYSCYCEHFNSEIGCFTDNHNPENLFQEKLKHLPAKKLVLG